MSTAPDRPARSGGAGRGPRVVRRSPPTPSGAGRPRGPRVVMLVDNGIVGDSRVQKQARSMAEYGFAVTLVGRRLRRGEPERSRFNGVPTRLVHVPQRAGLRPQRSTLLRSPLAYRSPRVGNRADALADAALDRARTSTALLETRGKNVGLRRVVGRARTAAALLRRATVHRRLTASERLWAHRQVGSGLPETTAAKWWRSTMGDRAWERLDPSLWDWELAYGPVVDRLQPDLIHANDARMLHVAVRAKLRAAALGRDVRIVWDVHEYLAGVASWSQDRRWQPAQVALQRQFAPFADAVVTVSDTLASMLQEDHHLVRRPTVVLNAPEVGKTEAQTDVRRECGLHRTTPLVVYSGGAKEARGLHVMVDAMPLLPGVHTALVVRRTATTPISDYVVSLMDRAKALGVDDRLHVLPYVAVDDVVPFLSTADVGVFPGLPYVNHSISLVTKFMEYSHARLPIVVTNVRTMAATVRETGQGEVFEPQDVAGYATAVSAILADKSRYVRAYEDAERMAGWTWGPQAARLNLLYREVLGLDAVNPGRTCPG